MADGDKPLSQDDIDALLAAMDEPAPSPAPTAAPVAAAPSPAIPAPAAPSSASGSTSLDQDEIDRLLAGIDAQTEQRAASDTAMIDPEASERIARDLGPAAPGGLSDVGSKPSAPASPAAVPADRALGQDEIDALLAQIGGDPPAAVAPAPAPAAVADPASKEGPLSQDDIDVLLRQLNGPEPEASAPAANGSPTPIGLTQDALADLVKKHEAGAETEAPVMIDQSDIDALLNQLAAAGADGADAQPALQQALASKEAEIKAAQAGAPAPDQTLDAVDASKVLASAAPTLIGANATTSSMVAAPAATQVVFQGQVPWVTPRELRGARWLLAAAVVMLAAAAATMAMTVGSLRSLVQEVRTARESQLAPTDSYADDLGAALGRLGDHDDLEVAKAERFLMDLKKRHPTHVDEISLALARHFRARGDHRAAAREYAALGDSGSIVDDPRILIEHADSLDRVGDRAGALRQLYSLLAAEGAYTGEKDRRGMPRTAVARAVGQDAVAEAWLMIGRLADAPLVASADRPSAAVAGHDAGTGHGGGDHAAPAADHGAHGGGH